MVSFHNNKRLTRIRPYPYMKSPKKIKISKRGRIVLPTDKHYISGDKISIGKLVLLIYIYEYIKIFY